MRDMIGSVLFNKPAVLVGLIAVGIVAVVAGAFALQGLIIWALWNALVPALAGGPSVTYWQGVLIGVALSIVGAAFGRR